MSFSPLDDVLHAGLLGDPPVATLLGGQAQIDSILEVEAALARIQGQLEVIPARVAADLVDALAGLTVTPEQIAPGFARDGVAAPALVAALRARIPADAGAWLHFGATSQDVADLGLILRLKRILVILEARLDAVMDALAILADAHLSTPCLARTRMQAAAPTIFGWRVAQWLLPLQRAKERLAELKPRLLVVQLGGATGTMSAFGPRALELSEALAQTLGLGAAEPWHTARDRLEEMASWLAMLANALGKIGLDAMMLAQSEIAEIRFEGAGGSSTLPQKQNPVAAETLVALARHAALMAGGMHQANLAMNERDGVAWSLEWLCLPDLVLATGSALERARQVTKSLRVDEARMRHNLDSMQGLVLAEAATFALAEHVPRPEATRLVKKAVEMTAQQGGHLLDHLAALGDWPVEWSRVRDPLSALSTARQMAERVLARARLRAD